MWRGATWLKRFWGDEAGAALVEMTLITPLMVVLSAGVFEFSSIIHSKLLVEVGVRDGARYFARCDTGSNFAACETVGKNIAVTGQATSGGTARVTGWAVADVTIAYSKQIGVTVIDVDTGEENYRSSSGVVNVVRVSTDYAYSGTGLWTFLGFGNLTLSVSHDERVLGN
jgi:Flp pilus assembly protein TadG